MNSSASARPLVGIFIVLASAVTAHLIEGGHVEQVLQPRSFLAVFGITLGVVLMACGFMEPLRQLGTLLRTHDGAGSRASDFASLRRALHLVIPSAPLAGFIGSVLGMMQVLSNLSDPATVGAGLALSMIAILYGLFLAMVAHGLLAVGEGRWDDAGPSDGDSPAPEPGPTSGRPVLGAAIVLASALAAHLAPGRSAEELHELLGQLTNSPAALLMCGATLGALIMPSGLRATAAQLSGLMRAGGDQDGDHAHLRRALGLVIPIALLAGLVGSVLGSIHVMGHLDDPSKLGPGIAVAYTALLYAALIALLSYGLLALAGGGRARGGGPPQSYALFYAVLAHAIIYALFAIVLFSISMTTPS